MSTPPVLVAVTGAPAAGKTTLARRLADELALPVVSKDDLKEVLFDTLGVADRAWSARLGAASVSLLLTVAERLLERGASLVIDANLDTDRSAHEVAALRSRVSFRLVELHLTVGQAVMAERMRARARHPGHPDHEFAAEAEAGLHAGRWRPLPSADESVLLDTSTWDDASVDSALRRVVAAVSIR